MLAVFCLRLAFGLLASLLLLLPYQINPRFYRVHFLTALGLGAGAFVVLFDSAGWELWLSILACLLLCALGSMSWSIDNAPGGNTLIVLGTLVSGLALALLSLQSQAAGPLLANDFTSAAVLGTATTSMLLGHSYLIAPTMSIKPLLRLLLALGLSLLLRSGMAGYELWLWTETAHAMETETILWLVVRWGVGLLLPLMLGWMAWETAQIRSTQSATGILYVVVICCFLGELTSQLLAGGT